MAEFTPTPWTMGEYEFDEGRTLRTFNVWGNGDADFVGFLQDMRIEDAEFIMRAANGYADLLAALEEIAKGEGAFSMDPLSFASNTIENMKEIANAAIAKARGAG